MANELNNLKNLYHQLAARLGPNVLMPFTPAYLFGVIVINRGVAVREKRDLDALLEDISHGHPHLICDPDGFNVLRICDDERCFWLTYRKPSSIRGGLHAGPDYDWLSQEWRESNEKTA